MSRIFIVLLILPSLALSEFNCSRFFSSTTGQVRRAEATDNFISYLEELLEKQVMKNSELVTFSQELEKGIFINPISKQKVLIDKAALLHQENLESYLAESLDEEKIKNWARAKILNIKVIKSKRDIVKEETRIPYQKFEFHKLKSGSFIMGLTDKDKHKVILSQDIEVMSTLVTQAQWSFLMGENPSFFASGDEEMNISINNKDIVLQLDHPVENLTFYSMLVFANKLSVLHGYQEVYDLSHIKWKNGTKAENGTLQAVSGFLRIHSNSGEFVEKDYYKTTGYRLPTEAEQEFLLRKRGKAKGKYHFGDNEDILYRYAWYFGNSDDKTHAVAQLKPLVIDGQKFYDVHGNVTEQSFDQNLSYFNGPAETEDPIYFAKRINDYHTTRGGSFDDNAHDLQSGYNQTSLRASTRSKRVGFRLVRTLPKDKK